MQFQRVKAIRPFSLDLILVDTTFSCFAMRVGAQTTEMDDIERKKYKSGILSQKRYNPFENV